MRPRIGIIGSSNIDLVTHADRLPQAGETLHASAFAMSHGGKGANQAVAAAKLGADVVFVSCVGDDAFGHDIRGALSTAGVDVGHVRIVPDTTTGTATILVEPSGENRILVAAGANAALAPADIDAAADALRRCSLIVLQHEVSMACVHYAIDWAAAAGLPVLLNPAPADADLDRRRLAKAAFVVPNQTELAFFTGHRADTLDDATTAAQNLRETGVSALIVTLGADGALIVDGSGSTHIPGVNVSPIDTTGAGDAFVGAFATEWVASRDVASAVAFAVGYAADSITRPGAQAAYADRASFVGRDP